MGPFDFSGLSPRKGTSPPPTALPAPAKEDPFDFSSLHARSTGPATPQAEAPKPTESKTSGWGWLTQSFLKNHGGEGATEKIQKIFDSFEKNIPPGHQYDAKDYTRETVEEVLKEVGGGGIDFLSSPVGATLIAAHAIPQTRLLATGADVALGIWQGVDTYGAIKGAFQDPTPQNVGHAIASAAMSWIAFSGAADIKKLAKTPELGKITGSDIRKMAEKVADISPEQKAAQAEKGNLRHARAKAEADFYRIESALRDSRDHVDTLNDNQRYDAIRAIETSATGRSGIKQADPKTQNASNLIIDAVDKTWDSLIALNVPGIQQHYYENYFPRYFKEFERAGDTIRNIFAKRPFTGTQGFRYKRSLLGPVGDIVDPRYNPNPNLHLVTTNFVELGLMKIHEMLKFKMAIEAVRESVGRGALERVLPGDQVTPGWMKIEDRIIPKSELPQGGSIYAAPEIAKAFNNLLAPGLGEWMRKNIPGEMASKIASGGVRSIVNVNNATARFLVMWSAFHPILSAHLAITDELGLAATLATRGKFIDSAKAFARSAGWAPFDYFRTGGKLMAHAKDSSRFPQFAPFLDAIEKGGGRVGIDMEYRSRWIDDFFRSKIANSRNRGGSAIVPRIFKRMVNFTMEELVPKIKLGAAMRMMDVEMERWGANWENTVPVIEQRRVFGRIIDSIDNRHGQLVYDNLFWPRMVRDMGFMSMQFVGWTLGSFREAIGGITDIPQSVIKGSLGQGWEMTPRTAWTLIGMPLGTVLANGILQYYLTGKYPDQKMDLLYPRNGKKTASREDERIVPPYAAYARTYSQTFAQSIANTIRNRVSNVVSVLWGIFANNADYQGRQLWDPGDEVTKNIASEMSFALERMEPLPFQRFAEDTESDTPAESMAMAFTGTSRAPITSMRTGAENLLADYTRRRASQGPISEEQYDRSKQSLQISLQLAQKKIGPNEVLQAVKDGTITRQDGRKLLIESRIPVWNRRGYYGSRFFGLEPAQELSVWRAATLAERREMAPLLLIKKNKILQDKRVEYRNKWSTEIDKLLAEYREEVEKQGVPPESR